MSTHQATEPPIHRPRRPVRVLAAGRFASAGGTQAAQVALAWHFTKPVVTAPIIGVTRVEQLEEAIGAVDLDLSAEDVALLEEPYVPHPVAGHV